MKRLKMNFFEMLPVCLFIALIFLSNTGWAQEISVSPGSHNFGDAAVNGTSPAQTFEVLNTGSASIDLGQTTIDGSDNDKFDILSDGCSWMTLNSSETCTFKAVFKPTSEGSHTATIKINTENYDTLSNISLSGTGAVVTGSPDISIDKDSHDFGYVNVETSSETQSFTVKNDGTADLVISEITITGADRNEFKLLDEENCTDQATTPTGTCTAGVYFQPESEGIKNAQLTIISNDPDTSMLTVPLTGGRSADVPNISVDLVSHDFGSAMTGTSSGAQAFVVSNKGMADLLLGKIAIEETADAGEFEIQDDACSEQTLSPEGTCSFKAVFKPTSEGSKTANIMIPSDDPDMQIFRIGLDGTGEQPAEYPDISANLTSHNFNAVNIEASSSAKAFEISNSGSASLLIYNIVLTGPDAAEFRIQDNCSEKTLAPSGYCSLEAVFSPTSKGNKIANIEIPSNDPDTPLIIALVGTGTHPSEDPDISVTPVSHNYNNVIVLTGSQPASFNISNIGAANLVTGLIRITGKDAAEFSIQSDSCSEKTISSSGSCSLVTVFSPTSEGSKSATVEIPSDDPDTPKLIIPLAGRAVQQGTGNSDISIMPGSHAFGPVYSETSSSPLTFEVTNTGASNLIMAPVEITGTNAAAFSIVQNNCSWQPVGPSEKCSFDVVFSPTSKGSKNANLEIQSNDPDQSTFVILVSGVGVQVWRVCTSGCNYTSIQAAIDGASDGDAVLVGDGTYSEDINFNGKDITLTVTKGGGGCDVNGDGLIGLEEVIQTLRILVGADQ
ncbi:MAG: choice-of-anchor D domain-containing protein [Desulfobacteraceae bacterium]|nr:choice-of-anchor D domain-containing protein [Desulfobacteraceae bacterium]